MFQKFLRNQWALILFASLAVIAVTTMIFLLTNGDEEASGPENNVENNEINAVEVSLQAQLEKGENDLTTEEKLVSAGAYLNSNDPKSVQIYQSLADNELSPEQQDEKYQQILFFYSSNSDQTNYSVNREAYRALIESSESIEGRINIDTFDALYPETIPEVYQQADDEVEET